MNFNLEIPAELITENSNEIKYELLKDKTVVGLSGFSKSGKDTIGKLMVDRLNFKRISFGDILKKDLDEYMKSSVYENLKSNNININLEDINFLFPKTSEVKEILRPYMIWFGEEMKKRNGIHHWTNRALEQIGDNKKVVITDVRRINELELFKSNREFHNRKIANKKEINLELNPIESENYDCEYESLLIHINQFKLTDGDQLTLDTIIMAHEQWLFDDIVYIDSRIPDNGTYREQHVLMHLHRLIKKFPHYFV